MAIKSGNLSERKVHKLIEYFTEEDESAEDTSVSLDINRNTINNYFKKFRIAIYQMQIEEKEKQFGTYCCRLTFHPKTLVEINKEVGLSKSSLIGLFRNDRNFIFTELIPDAKSAQIRQIMLDDGDQIIFPIVAGRRYNGLIDPVKNLVFHIDHRGKIFGDSATHEEGLVIRKFWKFSQMRMKKFYGISKQLDLHLKECEWRWNLQYDSDLTSHLVDLIKYRRTK